MLAASIFAVSNVFRGEYRLPNFFTFKPQLRPHHPVVERHVDLPADGSASWRRSASIFARLDRAVLCRHARRLLVAALLLVRITALARAAGLISAQRIFLIGTGANVNAFINRYEPWTHRHQHRRLPLPDARCRATPRAEARHATLDRDLAEAVASVRSLEPDAIFLLLPWSSTATIERCAETFLTLPVEIHLGPEQILHKFDDVQLTKLGPLSSLQLTRLPLSRIGDR